MTKTIWVDTTGASTTYVPREKPIQESVAPFSGTISGAAPATTNLGTNSGQRILAADGTWIPQPAFTSGGADQLETLRPSVISTSYSANPPTVTDSAKAYDVDTNHATTFGQWYAAQEARINNRVDIFSLTTWASKTQTWTAATINVSRSYAILQDGESASVDGLSSKTSSVKYEFSTNNGSSWTTLGTDTQSSIPTAPQTLSMALGSLTPTMGNILVKVTITRGGGGTIYEDGVSLPGLTGEVDLKLFDVWIDGTYAGGAGNITCNNLTVTGDATFQNKIYDSTASAGTTGQVLKVAANGKVTWATDSAGTGTVTSITTTGANGVTISGGSTQTITTSGTFALALGNITPTSISTGTGSFSGDVEFASSIKSPSGSNSPIVIAPDGTGHLHLNTDSVRIGDNNLDAKIVTRGAGDLILTTHEDSTDAQGIIRIYDGANQNITINPSGTGQVQVGSDQVVTLAASQTLTNKSISGSTNTFSNIPNSATTATSANTASAIVARDASGNFSAGTITATLSGNATNVTGTVAVANGGTGLTSLTAGYIPYGNGTSAFGSSANLFWNSTNSRLGIGTTSPADKLQIAAGRILLDQDYQLTWQNAGTNRARMYGDSGNNIVFENGSSNTERMRINASGQLVLGNGDTSATPTTSTFRATDGSGTDIAGASLAIQGGRSTGTGTGGSITFNTAPASGTTGSSLNSPSERMRINSLGNVGIGTSSPSRIFHVTSAATAATCNFTSTATPAYSATAYNGGNARILLVGGNASGATTGIQFSQTGSFELYFGGVQESAGAAAFVWQGYSGAAYAERMRLDSSGNLGVGTSSPSAPIHIQRSNDGTIGIFRGTSNAQLLLSVASGNLVYDASNGNATHVFQTNSTERMRIDSSGNVGIGTSSPATGARLHVLTSSSGNTLPNNAPLIIEQTGNTVLAISGSSASEAGLFMPRGTSAYYTGIYRNDTALLFRNNDAERMRITSGGDLGLGTSSINSKVQIVADSAIAENGSIVTIATGGGNLVNKLNLGVSSANNYAFIQSVKPGTDVYPLLLNPSGGNVGIGTASPTNKLQVNGVMVGNNAAGSYTKGFGGILTTTSTSTPTGGSSGDFALIY